MPILLAILLLGFQNCSDPYQSSKSSRSTVLESNSGNGNAYDGKIVVKAPEYMSPGETVTIYIEGGAPPYNIYSDVVGAQFVMQSEGVFQFTLPDTDTGQMATINVSDAEGSTGLATIRIWGVNKWFFYGTRGIDTDEFGNIYVTESDFPSLTVLSSQGQVQQKITNKDIPNLNFKSPSRLAVAPDGIVYVVNNDNKEILGVEPVGKTVVFRSSDSNGNLWNSCGGINHIKVNHSNQVVVSCKNQFFILNNTAQLIHQFSVNAGADVLSFAIDENDQILAAKKGGVIETYSSTGQFISQLMVKGKNYINEMIPVDLEILDSSNLLMTIYGNDHYLNFTVDRAQGDIGQYVLLSGPPLIYLGETIDIALLPDGRPISCTDMSNIVIGDASDFSRTDYFGPASQDLRGFYFPQSIHIDSSDHVTVVDNWNYRITRFDKQGQVLATNYQEGEDRWLKFSEDVEVSNDGTIFAANTGESRIEVIDPQGVATHLSSAGSAPGQLNGPMGLAIVEDKIYVADSWNERVQVLNLSGDYLLTFDQPKSVNTVGRPVDILALDESLLVLDQHHAMIHVYRSDGSFIHSFEIPRGHSAGPLWNPSKLALDASRGLIYVTDSGNNRLVVFNTDGQFLATIGQEGNDFGSFRNPKGIAIDSKGFVYVVDTDNSRIQILPPFQI